MDIHIDKKIVGLMFIAFVIGILLGAMIGFHHGGYGRGFQRDHMYFLQRGGEYPPFMMGGGVRGNVQYFDQGDGAIPPVLEVPEGSTSAPVKPK